MEFSVDLYSKTQFYVEPPAGMVLTPLWYDATDQGGPYQAQIRADGDIDALWHTLLWLGYRVTIRNRDGDPVWWGIIEEATVSSGNVQVGLSLTDMSNSVTVAYTQIAADGSSERKTTTAATDSLSISRYGTKEILLTLSDTSAAAAESKRDVALETLRKPVATIAMEMGQPVEATLRCAGYMSTLGWTYYSRADGWEEYDAGGTAQAMGAGAGPSTVIGFNADNKIIFNVGTALTGGSKFVVSGSASNNGTFTVANLIEQEDETYTASTIAFAELGMTNDDDIYDSASGLGNLAVDDVFQIEGSTSNDGIYTVANDGAAAIEVVENVLTYEAAGASVTLRRRNYVNVVESVVEEDAGASVTINAWGVYVAQSFTQEINANWTVDRIAIRICKVGDPTDSVVVSLYSNNSGYPGTVMDFGMVDADDIPTTMGWVEFQLNNTDTISYGTTYWIVVSRSGSNSLVDYYTVDVDEEAGYTLGTLKLWDGSGWQSRWTDADMAFRVLGAEETTLQIDTIASNRGEIADVEILDASGVYSNQYREGDNTALDEVLGLLESGTSAGKRLIATVNTARRLLVSAQTARPTNVPELMLQSDGALRDAYGMQYAHGKLPVGVWVTLVDVPAIIGNMADVSPFYVSRAQFDTERGAYTLEPQGRPSPWEIAEIGQG